MINQSNTPQLLSPAEAAARLRVSVGTLAIWRCRKRYSLRYLKIGSNVFYRISDIERFEQSRTVDPERQRT